MRITTERLEELLDRLRADDGTRRIPSARFDDAQFPDEDVHLEGVRFLGAARFDDAQFPGAVHFDGAQFLGDAHFDRVHFSGDADFRKVQFSAEADLRWTMFEGRGRFDEALFTGAVRFDEALFSRDAVFERAQFSGAHHIGPLTTGGSLVLDRAVFQEHVTVAVRAARLVAVDARFRSGTDILVQSAEIEFDRATFGGTSTVSSATPSNTALSLLMTGYEDEAIPSVVSLRGARVVDLAIAGVDLRTCSFHGAHGLAGVRLEQVLLAEPPTGWTRSQRWPFPLRWTRRVAIAEEHQWRAETYGWPEPRRLSSRSAPSTPAPHQIAAIYRALRKGQEERKDEPGAADFYYGEMEMRRHSTYVQDDALSSEPPYRAPTLRAWERYDNTRRTPRAEKLVLWLYWLTSGYGLRASRALAALFVTIVAGAVLFSLFGFEAESSDVAPLLFAMKSSLSLFREPEADLTNTGEAVAIVLRLLGPLFFGLALLSLRGRVKR